MIHLPWPDKRLSPNAREDRRAISGVRKRYRRSCAWLVRAAGYRPLGWAMMHVRVTFCPPDKRRRDLDNMLASIKSGLDGVADAIGVDDSRWELTIRRGDPVNGGSVRVEFGPPTDVHFVPFLGSIGDEKALVSQAIEPKMKAGGKTLDTSNRPNRNQDVGGPGMADNAPSVSQSDSASNWQSVGELAKRLAEKAGRE